MLAYVVATPPLTVMEPVPRSPTTKPLELLEPLTNRPFKTLMARSNRAVPEVSPCRLTVPVLVSEMPPVPEIVLVTVSDVVWLNCSVPSAVTLPVMLPPFSMTAVTPGAIVPPLQAVVYVVVAACAAESTTNWHARSRRVVTGFTAASPQTRVAPRNRTQATNEQMQPVSCR